MSTVSETTSPLTDAIQPTPSFDRMVDELRRLFFSRDAELWPIYRDPGLAKLIDFRRVHLPDQERIGAYPEGRERLQELRQLKKLSGDWQHPQHHDPLLEFTAALSKNWEDPAAVENVICMPCDPAIYGAVMGTVANPNLVYQEYAGMAEELEKAVVRQVASLVGYDPERATGVFTQGGTFCNMYGYLFGIRKAMPQSLHLGLEYGQDYRIINSQGGHYSNTTNLSVLGVNIDRKTIRLKLTTDNNIDLSDLEDQLVSCFRLGCVVPTIMLTMGTTDTFGVDPVKPVHDLCERLCHRFQEANRPHIHVDAAVGWPLIFFLDYDFSRNPLEINPVTLEGLQRNVERFRELKYADSFTVDFQKWGFVPYTSSLVMVKDRSSMQALEHDPENFSYFERDVQGQTHLQSTIECSRGAAGVFGAYSAMKYLGKEGYQVLIAHGLQNADYFRHRLAQVPGVHIMAPQNRGPSAGFRLYDSQRVTDADQEFEYERSYCDSAVYRKRVQANTAYHRELFLRRGKQHLYTNWVQFISHTKYDEHGNWDAIPGEKAVFMNPMTTRAQIDGFIRHLQP